MKIRQGFRTLLGGPIKALRNQYLLYFNKCLMYVLTIFKMRFHSNPFFNGSHYYILLYRLMPTAMPRGCNSLQLCTIEKTLQTLMDIIMNYLCDSLRKSFKLGMMVHAVTLAFGRLSGGLTVWGQSGHLVRLCQKKRYFNCHCRQRYSSYKVYIYVEVLFLSLGGWSSPHPLWDSWVGVVSEWVCPLW